MIAPAAEHRLMDLVYARQLMNGSGKAYNQITTMPHLTGSGHYVFQASESSKDLGSTTKSSYIYPPGTEALSMVSSLRLPLDLLIISPKLKALNDKGAIPSPKV
ncbi:hypothetical protein OIU78_020588 [Salix suchowensis]|nr:hypothetical protein OIU78_020588 [Salix suchowensis]